MKPADFGYYRPTTVQEAVSLLAKLGPDAKVLAGGQSLLPLMNFRLARPSYLVDINKIPELGLISREQDKVRIGALVRHATLLSDPTIRECLPILAETARYIGHLHIRNRGTFGGSVVHADAAAELPVASVALGANFRLVGPAGERIIPAEDFFLTYLTTVIEPGELLVEIEIPVLSPKTGFGVREISRRHGDFAIVLVIALLELAADDTCQDVRFVVGGVSDTPLRVAEVEEYLIGRPVTEETLAQAAALAADVCEPEADLHASADYRREMVKVLGSKALQDALSRVKGATFHV
ncbi:FAD binding domain-containing protein [Brevibacillus marinus]|uniref:FAD binding domain-containing protein n=1 Tax=Brevibacillus marinus TaxID=2496837 RepID=UPI0013DFD58F|nr:xanthine dehydrogenase family protein subunit M [Brevibacillus marinus]